MCTLIKWVIIETQAISMKREAWQTYFSQKRSLYGGLKYNLSRSKEVEM